MRGADDIVRYELRRGESSLTSHNLTSPSTAEPSHTDTPQHDMAWQLQPSQPTSASSGAAVILARRTALAAQPWPRRLIAAAPKRRRVAPRDWQDVVR